MKIKATLNALYSFPGFRAGSGLKGLFGDPQARIISLERRQKKRAVHAALGALAFMIIFIIKSETLIPAACASTSSLSTVGYSAAGARP
jgi:hypothetical protein